MSAWTTSPSAFLTLPGSPHVGQRCRCIRLRQEEHGQLHRLGCRKGKIVWSVPELFSVWSGALATAGNVVFYGTLEGYLKAVDAKTGKELYKFKTRPASLAM